MCIYIQIYKYIRNILLIGDCVDEEGHLFGWLGILVLSLNDQEGHSIDR